LPIWLKILCSSSGKDRLLTKTGYFTFRRDRKEAELRHINFHIGAPRIAPRIVQALSKAKSVRNAPFLEILRPKDYKNYLRHLVNGSNDILTLATQNGRAQATFLERLSQRELLVASQSAMMAHPRDVYKDGVILPGAEARVARLSHIFAETEMDLHLTITHPADYLRALQGDVEPAKLLDAFSAAVPSWHEFAIRLRDACPNRRLLVWDFEAPDRIALAFAMTMVSFDEEMSGSLRAPVAEAIRVSTLMPKILDRNLVPEGLLVQLDARYEEDLTALDNMENTVLIRSDLIPEELRLAVG
jgi:hypothetical protein